MRNKSKKLLRQKKTPYSSIGCKGGQSILNQNTVHLVYMRESYKQSVYTTTIIVTDFIILNKESDFNR